MTTAQAYEVCRGIARREAKNFYHAFRVLPRAKSDAMCAVYAFMRRADDLSDDESLSLDARRTAAQAWLDSWRAARGGQGTQQGSDTPIFQALADTQRRFAIPDALLEQLVQGTMLDLDPDPPGVARLSLQVNGAGPRDVQVYRTFPDLYSYCYLVASVVGLVCIRVFGYSDPAAELLAERTGVAFQLTNILRDVKEDAERGRIYLPQDMLQEFDVSSGDILNLSAGAPLRANDRALITALSVQAWEFYEAARQLLPLIDPDSRAALWVMVEIYSRLLGRIDREGGDVFSNRAGVPTAEKLMVLARGAAMAFRARAEPSRAGAQPRA